MNMLSENIEQNIGHISDVPLAASVNESKIKDKKKVHAEPNVKMCKYFKDTPCKIPFCDMKACEQCNEGYVYCTRVNFIKNLLSKVFVFFIGFLIFTE